jgi:hypothetical protein
MACSSSLAPLAQLLLLAGPEHGGTIPLPDKEGLEIPQCSGLLPHRVCYRLGRWAMP